MKSGMLLMGVPKPENVMAGHVEEEARHHRLLLRHRNGRDKEADAQHAQDKQDRPYCQNCKAAAERHAEPKRADDETRAVSKSPIRKNGTVFPRMNSNRLIGVTMICSSVPISRSRTTAKAVRLTTMTRMRLPITPGTKNH